MYESFEVLKQKGVDGQPVAEVELPLFLLYHIHQTIPAEFRNQAESNYGIIARNLLEINFLACNRKECLIMLFDNIVRYSTFFQNDAQFIPGII